MPKAGRGGRATEELRVHVPVFVCLAGACEGRNVQRFVLRAAPFFGGAYHCCSRSAFLTLGVLLEQYLVILALRILY